MKNKNIWLLPTDKPSSIWIDNDIQELVYGLFSIDNIHNCKNQNIYITNDEKPKDGTWVIQKNTNKVVFLAFGRHESYNKNKDSRELFTKIILTTDQDLIKDGVQKIDDEFLEWFVKNPSCEEVEIDIKSTLDKVDGHYHDLWEIIIPKEEPKQLFTDHPITELGDKEFVEAPIRECELISYDDNKYCYVKVEGIEKEIKRCYIYPQKGRCGDVDCVSIDEIKELLKEEPKQESYICPHTKIQCDDECCVSAEDCHIISSLATGMVDCKESKQETLEEVAERIGDMFDYEPKFKAGVIYGVIEGAKWEQEQDNNKYSEEELKSAFKIGFNIGYGSTVQELDLKNEHCDKWFEQFKKK